MLREMTNYKGKDEMKAPLGDWCPSLEGTMERVNHLSFLSLTNCPSLADLQAPEYLSPVLPGLCSWQGQSRRLAWRAGNRRILT